MTALAADRQTPRRSAHQFSLPCAAAVRHYAGSIVCLNASGLAVKGATSTTLKTVGVAQENVDNTNGAAGDLQVPVERGCWRFANSASTDQITLADYGSTCYVVDDQTVAKTNGTNTRIAAGIVRDVDAAGVWVEF